MRLQLAEEFGAVLVSRTRAAELRRAIEAALRSGDDVVVDLQGVSAISPSFADELFAKTKVGPAGLDRLSFENVPESVEPLIRFVRSGRRQSSVPAQT
jgi:anti-anti-sigma regulatory factor